MQRDMELVRKIIIDLSKGEYKSDINLNFEEDKLYYYHLKIMRKENLISFKETPTKDLVLLSDVQLEWKGNDFLKTFSNNSVWEKTKDFVKRKGLEEADMYVDMLIEFGKAQIKQWLGME